MKSNNMKLHCALVESAMLKRQQANRLLAEAEEDLVKARELLGDDFEKEERK